MNQAQLFGSYLRAERELRQITLAEVSAVTKIPLRTLELLEQGSWDELPPPVFVRGFVRSYARCVRISERDADQAFEKVRARQPEPAAPARDDRAADERRELAPEVLGRRRFELALLVIIVVILATITLSLLWRRSGHADIQASLDPQRVPAATLTAFDRRA